MQSRLRHRSLSPPNVSALLSSGLYQPPPPPVDQVLAYAQWVGLELQHRSDLTWIAEKGLSAPLPEHWVVCTVDPEVATGTQEDVYYFNEATGESIWDHPLDEVFRELARVFNEADPVEHEIIMKIREAKMQHVHRLKVDEQLKHPQKHRPKLGARKIAAGQTEPDDAHHQSTQASLEYNTLSTQSEVPLKSITAQTDDWECTETVGCDPMPVDIALMTNPITQSAETITKPPDNTTGMACNTTPGVMSLAPHPSFAQFTPSSVRVRSNSQMSGLPGWKRGESTRGSATLMSPAESHVDDDDKSKSHSDDDNTTPAQQPSVLPPGAMSDANPTAEALMKEMVASFQTQLVDHKREVQVAMRQDEDNTQQLKAILSGGVTKLPPPPRAFPQPTKVSQVSSRLQRLGWCTCYGLVFFLHITICIAVALGLPSLLNTEVSALLGEEREL